MHILLITGSTRNGSTNTAALRTIRNAGLPGVRTTLYDRLADLPAFDPDADREPLATSVIELRRSIAEADGVLFCTPEYAGALPGSFKNLLDWTVGGTELYGKPVAWINVAGPGRGEHAHASLATVLGYVGADLLEAACTRVAVPHGAVDDRGELRDPVIREALAAAVTGFGRRLAETGATHG